ncbi:MAG TPA: hypothetical protein VD862_02280 [Candidatus Paceibacterota bacterium]|nr:hypothetical protein [Candidatus Paceibacterota bacterium]
MSVVLLRKARSALLAGALAAMAVFPASPAEAAPVKIQARPERSMFVGAQPTRIAYVLYVQTGVELAPEDLESAVVAPFTLVSAHAGIRMAVPEVRDLEFLIVTLVVAPDPGWELGTHEVPSFAIRYGYDVVITEGDSARKVRRTASADAPAVKLEKVSVYAESDLLHEVARIGDANTATLVIHAASDVRFLNEFAPEEPSEDIMYLDALKLREPLVLLSTGRTEDAVRDRRTVTWTWRFAVMDVPSKGVPFPFPPVTWKYADDTERAEGSRLPAARHPADISTITVGAATVYVRSVISRDTTFEPPKGITADPPHERWLLLWLPVALSGVIVTGLTGYGMHRVVVFLRTRARAKKRGPAAVEPDVNLPDPVFEQAFWRRWLLRSRCRTAMAAYTAEPSLQYATQLRPLLARYIAACNRKTRLSREAAAALTASGLEFLVTKSSEQSLADLRELDGQLESGAFRALIQEVKA